ncbi:MAG TPA: DUF2927 domain-containing protein [Albidovulum sp.]|uniref:DUF2927 domain-containing protein n=1 Tax=Albidovulum sp. TaxID=1872424 RepID=UPI002CC99EFC|nr:DUF2927 domain-containing protein [Albidovulum sp.]
MRKGFLLPALLTTALLAACVSTAPLPPPPALPPPAPEPSAATKAGQDYYRKVEANYLGQGRMREDGGGPDTPFTTRDLVENFIAIAFYDEFTETNGALVAGGAESTLHRWQAPMRVALSFGASIPEDQRTADRAALGEFTRHLARITGHPVVLTDRNPNHTVFILNPEERTSADALIRAAAPQTSAAAIRSVEEMRPDIYCTAFTFSPGKSPVIDRAVSVIRGEMTPKLRALCIHEELAQSMGLINDSPRARPSIFNDNEEFALLTRQDELMLKMLYDPRLKPGMTLAEARPIVEVIAAGLMGGES